MVYIIDDDRYVRRGFEIFFKSAGYNCQACGSAEVFIELLPLQDQDILILDMHLPGMNGCELLAYLSARQVHIPVIVITAYDEPASRECARDYGAIAYLRKPVDGEALIDLIRYHSRPVRSKDLNSH